MEGRQEKFTGLDLMNFALLLFWFAVTFGAFSWLSTIHAFLVSGGLAFLIVAAAIIYEREDETHQQEIDELRQRVAVLWHKYHNEHPSE